ncbi:anthranilate phosphoribosyltransferase [Bowmanella sp. JS7-9]|uniref:Anthranilate phosphoribosyltransferase n=1 Tax=Pseudobowmanella zhangzhouensis TaxID=1537679 RepID=A0ABW1XJJ7_9ALTE|nr:anthranilate phosphoribosyltransferase [Bowmanella sp. JS7-9]TBX22461.1 anthranilate phosphoribosyltransferase [Bowmanella sp. JS7-9]
MTPLFEQLYAGQALTQQQSEAFFADVVNGKISEIELTAMLTALKFRGETPAEIAGAAAALINNANPFPRPDYPFADIVGTGGDGHNTINISSAAAMVAASCGVKVAKHGNRSVSSKSGSADLYGEFGMDLAMSAETARACLDEANLAFLFAPQYHAGIKHAMPVRQTVKSRTLFNLLGPLANPARPTHMMIGVYSPDLLVPFANTLRLLGYQRAVVVHGSGLDEVALHGATQVVFVDGDTLLESVLHPADFGLQEYSLKDIEGGEPAQNKALIEAVLRGHGEAAHRDAVAANAGLLLYLCNQADTLATATQLALQAMASGKPYQTILHAAEVSRG